MCTYEYRKLQRPSSYTTIHSYLITYTSNNSHPCRVGTSRLVFAAGDLGSNPGSSGFSRSVLWLRGGLMPIYKYILYVLGRNE